MAESDTSKAKIAGASKCLISFVPRLSAQLFSACSKISGAKKKSWAESLGTRLASDLIAVTLFCSCEKLNGCE